MKAETGTINFALPRKITKTSAIINNGTVYFMNI